MYKHTQRSWVGGRLDAELMGRQDLQKYFQGASELKNFLVRRQGYLSKRRGTDFACDLKNLLGTQNGDVRKIGNARLIPFVYDREEGYYILLTSLRAYVLSKDGIRLMDGTFSRTIAAYQNADYASATVSGDKRPYYVSIPYSDADLAQLDVYQSGDTLFLAHMNHRPASLVLNDGVLSYKFLSFDHQEWHPPRITSISASGTEGTGAEAQVSYVATYVRDGIESKPSAPVYHTYKLPWANTYAVTIKLDRGANTVDPDYYNVYKSSGTGYGLVSTTGVKGQVYLYPTISSTPVNIDGQDLCTIDTLNNTPIPEHDAAAGLIKMQGPIYPSDTQLYGEGAVTSGSLTATFPANNGEEVTKVFLTLDAYGFKQYEDGSAIEKYYNSHPYYKATLTCQTLDGSYSKAFSVTKTCKRVNLNYGWNEHDPNESVWEESVFSGSESPVFDFKSQIDEDEKFKSGFQVTELVIACYSDSAMTNSVAFAWRGLSYYSQRRLKNEFKDDYITPDFSNTPPKSGNHFSTVGDFPSCIGIHKQRLVLASTRRNPFMFWMSAVGDLYEFGGHETIREDDPLSATLAATEFPTINHIVVNRDLLLLADSGEWKVSPVSGNTISYKTISADMQSAIGCAKTLKPINVGDEIVFVKRSGEALLATRYNFTSDGYESQDLSVLSQWIFKNNPIVQMAYRQHPDSTIECVLTDGTVATLVYMKEHEVCAWSRHEFGGGWKAKGVATNKSLSKGSTEVMFLVERNGAYQMWKVRDDIPIRTNNKAIDHICLDALRELGEGELAEESMEKVAIGAKTYAGYLFEAELETIRPEAQGAETIQFELKNAKSAEVRVLDSGGFTVKPITAHDSYQQAVKVAAKVESDGLIDLKTQDCSVQLTGDNSGDGRIVIKSITPFPLNILSVSTNYEIQPLSGSAG